MPAYNGIRATIAALASNMLRFLPLIVASMSRRYAIIESHVDGIMIRRWDDAQPHTAFIYIICRRHIFRHVITYCRAPLPLARLHGQFIINIIRALVAARPAPPSLYGGRCWLPRLPRLGARWRRFFAAMLHTLYYATCHCRHAIR